MRNFRLCSILIFGSLASCSPETGNDDPSSMPTQIPRIVDLSASDASDFDYESMRASLIAGDWIKYREIGIIDGLNGCALNIEDFYQSRFGILEGSLNIDNSYGDKGQTPFAEVNGHYRYSDGETGNFNVLIEHTSCDLVLGRLSDSAVRIRVGNPTEIGIDAVVRDRSVHLEAWLNPQSGETLVYRENATSVFDVSPTSTDISGCLRENPEGLRALSDICPDAQLSLTPVGAGSVFTLLPIGFTVDDEVDRKFSFGPELVKPDFQPDQIWLGAFNDAE